MIRVNLLKPEHKEIKETAAAPEVAVVERKKEPVKSLILFLLVVSLFAYYYTQTRTLKKERKLLDTAIEEKNSLQEVDELLKTVEAQRDTLEKKINLINSLKVQQLTAVEIMDELSRNIPDWVWLLDTNFDRENLKIHGRALSNTLVADYIYNLENSPVFTSVNLISTTQQTAGRDSFIDFILTARYVFPTSRSSTSEMGIEEDKP
jgi:type IV pilus assembly protein PilN